MKLISSVVNGVGNEESRLRRKPKTCASASKSTRWMYGLPMIENGESQLPPPDMVGRVTSAFLILTADELIAPLDDIASRGHATQECIRDAAEGLRSVISAATLPFQLSLAAVQQRRFDRHLSAERIRSLKDVPLDGYPSEEQERNSSLAAKRKMDSFLNSTAGTDFIRNDVVYDLYQSLRSKSISYAAEELLIQTLVSTWAVFEHFASRFIIDWINNNPNQAKSIVMAQELRAYFGKQILDIDAIDEYGFDLTRSMGSAIFRGKRLDNLSIIRRVLETLFASPDIRHALGDELWMLNQRRHLFVHKRGLVDSEYLQRTNDNIPVGDRLRVSSSVIESYLIAVQHAVHTIAEIARKKPGELQNDINR